MGDIPLINLSSILLGVSLLALSIFHFLNEKRGVGILIFLGAFLIRCGFGLLESFPNIWDEQFHALVAKNLSNTPFTPRLYPEEVLPYDYTSWTGNYIWLHKQPWFLWQMAASIKIFGANIFAVRLPSFLMSAAVSVLFFSMGKKLNLTQAGFWAGLLWAVSFFSIQLNTGVFPTDHNDVAFVFYVTASVWAFLRYLEKPNFKRAALVGLLCGLAVLTKWLVGLSVFLIWSFYIAFTRGFNRSEVFRFLFSVLIAFSVFLPWNIYVFYAFPKEAAFEMAYNSEHFFIALEGHDQPWYFHFTRQVFIYGPLVLVSAVIGLYRFYNESKKTKSLLFWAVFVFVFFTVAATKMEAFTYVLASVIYISAGIIIALIVNRLKEKSMGKNFLPVLLFFILGWFSLRPMKIVHSHTLHNDFRKQRSEVAEAAKNLEREQATESTVAFNVPMGAKVIYMFYTQGVAYDFKPSSEDLKKVQDQGKTPLMYNVDTKVFEEITPVKDRISER